MEKTELEKEKSRLGCNGCKYQTTLRYCDSCDENLSNYKSINNLN